MGSTFFSEDQGQIKGFCTESKTCSPGVYWNVSSATVCFGATVL
jgi:hypothetical protein